MVQKKNQTIGSTNDWRYSELNTVNLNTNYLNNIGDSWSEKIEDTTWYVGGMRYDYGVESNAQTVYNYDLGTNGKKTKTYQAKVGLMYLSEYYYGALPTYWTLPGYDGDENDYRKSLAENWMNKGFIDWTITCASNDNYSAFSVRDGGCVRSNDTSYYFGGVRPSFSLKSSVVYVGGSGAKTDPVVIN